MASGYIRQSAGTIVTGNTILASDFNNEYNAILGAFDATTGHTHDGTVGGGAKIVASAKVEIDAQKKAALAEVKNEVSKLSLEIAQKVLGRELDAAKDQQSYINSLVDKMN